MSILFTGVNKQQKLEPMILQIILFLPINSFIKHHFHLEYWFTTLPPLTCRDGLFHLQWSHICNIRHITLDWMYKDHMMFLNIWTLQLWTCVLILNLFTNNLEKSGNIGAITEYAVFLCILFIYWIHWNCKRR